MHLPFFSLGSFTLGETNHHGTKASSSSMEKLRWRTEHQLANMYVSPLKSRSKSTLQMTTILANNFTTYYLMSELKPEPPAKVLPKS